MRNDRPAITPLLALYFLSGFSALVYEVLWSRMLGLVLGTTVAAWATVLAAYMGGMALGAVWGGRFADRSSRPLLLFTACEAGIGLCGLGSWPLVHAAQHLFVMLAPLSGGSPAVQEIVRAAFAGGVLIVPTMLMGATFPIIGRCVLSQSRGFGGPLGKIYSVNTFGAVAGATATGFLLLPNLGVSASLCCAAGINFIVSAAILGFFRNRRIEFRPEATGTEADISDSPRPIPLWLLPSILASSGFCAMAFEILWARTLVFFLTSTTYAFTAMLGVVLLGLAIGAMVASRISRGRSVLAWIAGLQLCIGFLGFAAPWLLHNLDPLIRVAESHMAHSWLHWITVRYAVSLAVVFPAAFCMGVTFPLTMGAAIRSLATVGRSIGMLSFLNTVGGIAGSLSVAFLLAPAIGTQRSFAIIALINCAAGVAVYVKTRRGSWVPAGASAAVTVALFIVSIVFAGKNPMVAYSRVTRGADRPTSVVSYREDRSASVAVLRNDRERTLDIDGFNAAGTYRYEYMHLMAHLPVLLSPSPDTALVICLGTGTTVGALGLHPRVKWVDCAEISSAVIASAHFFADVNNDVAANVKIHILHDDGRNHLLRSRRMYDVISLEPMHPYLSSATNLYSSDFYALCRSRLSSHGIMAQWAPLHVLTPYEYRTLIRSFTAVFPHSSLWFLGTEGVLIGAMDTLRIDINALKRNMGDSGVARDLARISLSDPSRLLSCFLMDERALKAYVNDGPLMTDDHPRIEFSAPRNLALPAHRLWLANMEDLERSRVSVLPFVVGADDASRLAIERCAAAASLVMRAGMSAARLDYFQAIATVDSALALMPGDTSAEMIRHDALDNALVLSLNKARMLRRQGILLGAEQAYLQALAADSMCTVAHTELTTLYNGLRMFDKGLLHAQKAVESSPDDLAMLVNLAVVYMNLNRSSEAEPLLMEALKIRANDERARYFLAMLREERARGKP